ncbi:right-handed parallel beta-helix repeat-containing protein [Chitinophaga defluvii]|uniref:Right-handed parallel beta-helix repeat-containing protein n=1 Tax=Chitinophaga defluvii TaxID=3163343 RepID=A0ABV2T806_9BACT
MKKAMVAIAICLITSCVFVMEAIAASNIIRMDVYANAVNKHPEEFLGNGNEFIKDSVLSVLSFGARGDDSSDDLPAFQACIDRVAANGGTCLIPAGKYIINGDLWVNSNVKVKGEGEKSLLVFKKGTLRILKNGSKSFYYTENYNNEIVPNAKVTQLKEDAIKGSSFLQLIDASNIVPGQLIYVYNNKKDSWTILEDSKAKDSWNSEENEMARKELFIVKEKRGNVLTLDSPLKFSYNASATVGLQVGAENVVISNFAIDNQTAPYAIMFEEPKEVTADNLNIKGRGGILFSHMAYKCLIRGCVINTSENRAINIENFSKENKVINNTVDYVRGGDAAIIILMSSSSNIISDNKIIGHGVGSSNEGGIFIHALCYDNKVFKNTIIGTAEGVGAYFGAFENEFYNNTIKQVRVGLVSFHSRNNTFNKNDIQIQTSRKGNAIGALVFESSGINVTNNNIAGDMVFGIQLQSSENHNISYNDIQGISDDKYSFGIKVINGGDKKMVNARLNAGKEGDTNGVQNNKISKVKFKIGTN